MLQEKDYLRKQIGYAGVAYFANTVKHNIKFSSFMVVGNTVISYLGCKARAGNILTPAESDQPYNFDGVTLTSAAPRIYCAEDDKVFTSIQASTNGGIFVFLDPID